MRRVMTLNLVNRGCERRGPQELNDKVSRLKVHCILVFWNLTFKFILSVSIVLYIHLLFYESTSQLVKQSASCG